MSALATTDERADDGSGKRGQDTILKKSRIQLDLAPRSVDRLNKLKLKTESSSYAEVIKNSLQLYEALIEIAEDGNEFLVRDKNGKITELKMFI